MESTRRLGTADVTYGVAPTWPANNKIWWDIVHTHNKQVDSGKFTTDTLTGSKSITLVMICAVMGMPIPRTYRLDTERAKGLADHPAAVKKYLMAVRDNVPPSGVGKIIEGHVRRFAGELGVSVQAVNEGLKKAWTLGKIDNMPSSPNAAPHTTSPLSVPQKADVDYAEEQLRKTSFAEVIGLDAVLDQVEANFTKAGKSLKENWREITKRNIEIWFSKNNRRI